MIFVRLLFVTVLFLCCNIVNADSITTALINDTATASKVVLVEDVSTNFLDDGFNFLGVIGFFLGLASLYFAKVTFEAQRQTELHTTNAPKSAQIGKLKDLPRHFYRNLICTCAMTLKYFDELNKKNGIRLCYPSESNVLKLKTLPDEIIYDIDEEEKSYALRHEFKLLLRNYNTEVEVASEHFSRAKISDEAIFQDIDNIIFKQLFLLNSSYDILLSLDKVSYPQIVADSLHIILKEHFKKLKGNKIVDKANNDENKNERGNKYLDYVNKILNDSKKFDEFRKRIDPKGALYRSYDKISQSILDYYSGKNKNNNITKERKEFNEILFSENVIDKDKKEIEIIVDKQKFINVVRREGSEKSNTLADFINEVSGITTFEKFRDVFGDKKDIKEEENYKEAYKNISSYFKFINQEKWQFRELLLVIVIMDCVLETKNIGMVNFESLSAK